MKNIIFILCLLPLHALSQIKTGDSQSNDDLLKRVNLVLEGKLFFSLEEMQLSSHDMLALFDPSRRPKKTSELLVFHAKWKAINNLILSTRLHGEPQRISAVMKIAYEMDTTVAVYLGIRHLRAAIERGEVDFSGRLIRWMKSNNLELDGKVDYGAVLKLINSYDFGERTLKGPSIAVDEILRYYMANRKLDKKSKMKDIAIIIRYINSWTEDPFSTKELFKKSP